MEPSIIKGADSAENTEDLSRLAPPLASRILRVPFPAAGEPPEYALVRAAYAGAGSVTVVRPNLSETVDVPAASERTLLTFGLAGCTSVLVATKDADVMTRATLTHYGPRDTYAHNEILERELMCHVAAGREPTEIVALCLVRGWLNAALGTIVPSGHAIQEIAMLRRTVERSFPGRNVSFEILPYDSLFSDETKGSAFIASWSAEMLGNALVEAHDEYIGTLFPAASKLRAA